MLGVITSMDAELHRFNSALEKIYEVRTIGGRRFTLGSFGGEDIVIVPSKWGKTSAATTAATLIYVFKCDAMILSGVAGSLDSTLRKGDVVVASGHVHCDCDWRPFYASGEVPFLGLSELPVDAVLAQLAMDAAKAVLSVDHPQARIASGVVATADRFVRSEQDAYGILCRFPMTIAVDSEGAAVAQVCFEHSVPFAAIRVISDYADHDAPREFVGFLKQTAAEYGNKMMREFIERYAATRTSRAIPEV